MVDDEIVKRLARVEAEAHALRQLLLSLVLGISVHDEEMAKTAIEIADTQVKPGGLPPVLLNMMLDELRAATGPETANDA